MFLAYHYKSSIIPASKFKFFPIVTYGLGLPMLNQNSFFDQLSNQDYIVGFVNLVELQQDVDFQTLDSSDYFNITFLKLLENLPFELYQFIFIRTFCYDLFLFGALGSSFFTDEFAVRSGNVLRRILNIRRRYMLQYAQRRVCSRMQSWFMNQMWVFLGYNKYDMFRHNFFNLSYTYRHLIRSDIYKAGMLLAHPNFHLFVQILSNPYFWITLQQTLNSYHRFK